MKNIDIRHAIVADAQAMRKCAEAAYQHYMDRIGKPPAPMLADYSVLAAQDSAFVAEIHGKLVGILVLLANDEGIILDNVAVCPEHQGKGIGRKLIQFAEDEARRRGFHNIDLYTNEAMIKNLAIYTHIGYVEVDRRSEDGYRRVYMRKNLDNTKCQHKKAAKLTKIRPVKKRVGGFDSGQIKISDDFDEEDTVINKLFYS